MSDPKPALQPGSRLRIRFRLAAFPRTILRMKRLRMGALVALVALTLGAGCGHPPPTTDLPLVWRHDKTPAASTAVDKAFAAGSLEVGEFKDGRAGDKDVVGRYEDDGFIVRTKGDVRAFWAGRLRVMLESSGARLGAPGIARFDAELLDFDCVEGNTFNATVRMRVTVTRHDTSQPWSKVYEGKGKRWGRTHNPDNFDEALSIALYEMTRKMVQDEEFASAVLGRAPEKAGDAKAL